jgi:hypothetical protein
MSSEKPEMLGSPQRCIGDQVMELETEIARLRRLVADLLSKNQQLRDAQGFRAESQMTTASSETRQTFG